MTDSSVHSGSKSIAVAQMNSGDDVSTNLKQTHELIATSAHQGAGLIVLPETFAFIGENQEQQLTIAEPDSSGRIQDFLSEQANKYDIWIVGGTIPLLSPDKDRVYAACNLYNSTGERVARYDKIHLFDVLITDGGEPYQESKTFYPGEKTITADTPFGKLGLAVCYDIRFPEMFRLLSDQGVEIIAIPAAFTATTGMAHWHTLLKARAVENLVYVAAAAQAGQHPNHRKTYGHSMIINPWGEAYKELSDEQHAIGLSQIDLEQQKKLRTSFPCLSHRILKITT